LPPPAAPPYSTSLSEDARYCVCGPGLGLKTTSCAAIGSNSAGLTSAGFCVVGVGVVTESFFFEYLVLLERFFVPFGKLAFNCSK
jgi:hypothetical protein